MKESIGVSPSNGNQGTTRGKGKNIFDLGGNRTQDLRIRSTVTRPTELRGRTEKAGEINGRSNSEVVGSIQTEVKKNFFLYLKWFPESLYQR